MTFLYVPLRWIWIVLTECENPQLVPTSLVDDGSDTVDVEITCTYSYAGPYVPTSGITLSMKAGPEGNLRSIIDIDTPEDGAETATFNGVSRDLKTESKLWIVSRVVQ